MGEQLRFLVVDDHPIFRQGMVAVIQSNSRYRVCSQAGSVAEALSALETEVPDMALVDISLGGQSGLDLVKALRTQYPDVRILVLSIHDESVYAERALKAQARGYLMKQEAGPVLLEAIATVLAGKIYLSEPMRERLLENLYGRPEGQETSLVERLSDRELEVLEHLGRGYGASEIAESLHLSVKTVNVHQERIKHKLSLDGTADLRKFAVNWVQSLTR